MERSAEGEGRLGSRGTKGENAPSFGGSATRAALSVSAPGERADEDDVLPAASDAAGVAARDD